MGQLIRVRHRSSGKWENTAKGRTLDLKLNLQKRGRAAAAALVALGAVSVAVPSASAATVTAQCQVIKIGLGGDIVGHVYGNASTLNDAKKDANKYVPIGHYKRHCRGVGQHPSGYFPGGGGGFRGGSF